MTFPNLWLWVLGLWRRAVAIPTAIHLFCAEMELRLADDRSLSPAARSVRKRILDALRAYRRRWVFPRNDLPDQFAPCFIDPDGRRCAVAALMEESGHPELASTVAREANLARIREMQVPGLGEWATASGLTPAEVARVQPMYPPTPEQMRSYTEFVHVVWVFVTLGAASIALNVSRLLWVYTYRWPMAVAGLLIGTASVYYGLMAETPKGDPWRPAPDRGDHKALAVMVGLAALCCGISRLVFDRDYPEADDDEEPDWVRATGRVGRTATAEEEPIDLANLPEDAPPSDHAETEEEPNVELVDWKEFAERKVAEPALKREEPDPPRDWKCLARRVFAIWLIANVCATLWHIVICNNHREETHVWICQRTGARLEHNPNYWPNNTHLSWDKQGKPAGGYDWVLVEPRRRFVFWKPWNWMSDLLIPAAYDPDELLRPPPGIKVT